MKTLVLGIGAIALAAGIGVVAAQHGSAQHGAGMHGSMHGAKVQAAHHMCGDAEAVRKHHDEMGTTLGLSGEQKETIQRISSEACAAMARYHEQILAVLTPEQREKMQRHHGAAK